MEQPGLSRVEMKSLNELLFIRNDLRKRGSCQLSLLPFLHQYIHIKVKKMLFVVFVRQRRTTHSLVCLHTNVRFHIELLIDLLGRTLRASGLC